MPPIAPYQMPQLAVAPPFVPPSLPTCPVIENSCSAVNFKKVPIYGASKKQKKAIRTQINRIRASHPIFAQYFDFVLAYLEGFSISVNHNTPNNSGQAASFVLTTRTLILNKVLFEAKRKDRLNEFLRHEMRHAYWFTMHRYSFASDTYTAHCYHPDNSEHTNKLKDAFKLGDDRVQQLKKLLYKNPGALSKSEQEKLSALRKACEKYTDLYYAEHYTPVEQGMAKKFESHIGLVSTFPDTADYLVGEAKIVRIDYKPKPHIVFELLDPLRRFVVTTEMSSRFVKKEPYTESDEIYEREAYLYGLTPPELIEEYYPELISYTASLGNRNHYYVHPRAHRGQAQAPIADALQNKIFWAKWSMENTAKIDHFWRKNSIKTVLSTFSVAINLVVEAKTNDFDLDNIRFALNHLLSKGYQTSAVNLLLARIENEKKDALQACRHYHRAFKQGAEFTFDDYDSCLDNLVKNKNWGEAKTIVQKALRKYQGIASRLPLTNEILHHRNYQRIQKLMEWKDRIHTLRSG